MTDRLIEGFHSFRAKEYDDEAASMPALVRDGQKPEYFIISCIDSRANPGVIFQPPPGTFFAHKAMGAIVRPYEQGTALAAALQFALIHMKVQNIIILGHTECGAIKALADNIQDEEIASFVQVAQKGMQAARDKVDTQNETALLRQAEKEIVLQSTENLKTYPSVASALNDGALTLKSWVFEMGHGNLLEYDEAKKDFVTLTNFKASGDTTAACC